MTMKLKTIAAGLALLALVPTAAMAHTDISIGLNLGGGYYEPAPVYVAPPPPVYYRPAAPAYYYVPSVRYGYRDEHREWRGYDRRRDWDHDRDRHRDDDDDDDRD